MEFRILGPAEVVAGGRSLDIGGERPHALLTLLLLNRNRVVAADSLIDQLWDERPPATASKTLQVYVSRLRKVLGPQRLVTRAPGYLLVVDEDELDLARFESLVAEARTGDARFASTQLREALALLKAEPLANVRHHAFAEAEARRIEELRLAALEDRIDADLALGEHGRLIGELESLVAEHPFRERLRAQLMLALYHSGRQKQALELYQRTRRELNEELGIEPGPSLRALQHAILNHDASLGVPSARSDLQGVPRSERKVVTAAFVDLVGYTALAERLDPEDVQALLAPYYSRVRGELERFGGTVEKFIGDAVMALFGVPSAREDDAERAVRAAFAVRESVADLMRAHGQEGLELRIGINTGEALVTFGGETGEPHAVGDVVNTAARLETAAQPDTILVGERTHSATKHAVEYRRGDDVDAKGNSAPITSWEAVAPLASIADLLGRKEAVELVGRRAELTLLEQMLARACRQREPHLVTLVGPPGIGKSRLVHELGRTTLGEDAPRRWLQGRCLPYGVGITFAALSDVVQTYLGILETDAASAASQKLRRGLSELSVESERDRVEMHLRPLLGLDAEDPGEGRAAAFAAWRRFLEAVADREPLIVVFEDLHWAEEDFLDFIDDLVEWAGDVPMLVVCTARPELLERWPAWAGGQRNATTIALEPLDETETTQLLQGLLGELRLPHDLERAVLERSGGVPLYAEEYIRMLGDHGYLSPEEDARRPPGETTLPQPETVQAILAARLDLLALDEKDLIGDAAVIGTVFWEGALAATTASPRSLVESRLRRLEKRDLVRRRRRTSVAGETEWAFRHVLVRDAAYAQLPRARRYRRHRLVAQWIESIAADRDDKIELLAHHYLQALQYATAAGETTTELADRARLVLREAGARANALNAPAAAARFLTSAVELWPAGDPERPRLLLELGRARVHAEMEGSEQLQAARKAGQASDPEVAAEAEAWLGHLAAAHGDHAASLAYLENAYARLERRPASIAKALVADKLAGRHMAASNVEGAFRFARSALRIYEKLGDERGRAEILDTIGSTRAAVGDRAGLADLEESIAVARTHDLPQSVARACLNLAYFLSVYQGLGDRVTALHSEGRAAAVRAGDARLLGYYQAVEAVDAFSLGRWDEARALCEVFLAGTKQTQHHQEHLFRLVRADIAHSRGETELALSDARRAIEFARAVREPQSLYLALGWGAWILDSGGSGDGSRYAEELLDRWVQQGRAFAPSVWILAAAFVLGPSNELERTLATTPSSTVWLDAALSVADGDWAAAADCCSQSGSRPSEAYARLRAAESLFAADRVDEANVQLGRALAFYRKVGATDYVARGERLAALHPALV